MADGRVRWWGSVFGACSERCALCRRGLCAVEYVELYAVSCVQSHGILLFYPVQSGSIWPNPAKRATKHVSKMKKSADLFRTFLS